MTIGLSYVSEGIETLKDHLHTVLQGVVETFGQAEVELPERRYVTMGRASHDCEQVTVSFQQLYLGLPGDQATQPLPCDSPRSAAVLVEIVRCLPTANTRSGIPAAAELSSTADKQAIDAWLLLESGLSLENWSGVLADVAVTEPQGGYQAVVMTLTMAMM